MNDNIRKLVEQLRSEVYKDNVDHVYLNFTEIERLYQFAQQHKNDVILITSTPTGMGSNIEVSNGVEASNITDHDSW